MIRKVRLQLIPHDNVSLGRLMPDAHAPLRFYIHPQTMKCLKNSSLNFDELVQAENGSCPSCKEPLHLGLWHQCPFCLISLEPQADIREINSNQQQQLPRCSLA